MARSYDLDTTSAKQADGGNYVRETGKYKGIFTRAEAATSQQGTEGIEFAFKTDSGASADFLTLWTHKSNGEDLPSLKTLNAIMTCLKVKRITPTEGRVEKYNPDTRTRELQDATVFADLMNKPVGLLLQKVWRADKPDKFKFEIAGVFEATTELTASEILGKASAPSKLAQMVVGLKDKHEKPQGHPAQNMAPTGGGSFDDFDSDIPF